MNIEPYIRAIGVSGDSVPLVAHAVLVVAAIAVAALAWWASRLCIPLVTRLTRKTSNRWDDVLLGERVLRSACQIVPAIVVWRLLPSVFAEFPMVREALARLTAIYITVMSARTIIVFADSFRLLEGDRRTSRQQYLYSFIGVLKIIIIFIAVIVVVAIVVNKDPSTLLAGLGAASALLMLAFQDTIKGLVAGIRLTSNDMVSVGDRITVPSAGADGIVEEITLTCVKVRNFDNTIITVTPQMLVDGSFQNWKGMKQNVGRKAVRKIFFDFRSIAVSDDGSVNLTQYRNHMEEWLKSHPQVLSDKIVMAHLLDATPTGQPVEFVFWLSEQDALPFEHAISEIMEHALATAPVFGLRVYTLAEQDV